LSGLYQVDSDAAETFPVERVIDLAVSTDGATLVEPSTY
jgi:hypothetical protein